LNKGSLLPVTSTRTPHLAFCAADPKMLLRRCEIFCGVTTSGVDSGFELEELSVDSLSESSLLESSSESAESSSPPPLDGFSALLLELAALADFDCPKATSGVTTVENTI